MKGIIVFKKIGLWITSLFENKKEKVEEVKEGKKPTATRHAKGRLEERHGEVLKDEMIASIISDIKNKKAEFVKEGDHGTQEWIVAYKNKKYRIIYNYKSECIITVFCSVKKKFIKPSRRKNNKRKKRLHFIQASNKREKTKFKKPYKRNKKVKYEEYSDIL
jgi:hypothetical protein